MRVVAIVVSLAITAVAVALAVKAVQDMLRVVRTGAPAIGRSDNPRARWTNMFKETLGHTRMLQWQWIGIMHWFVFAGFILLSSLVATAYGQIFEAGWVLPLIGHWIVFEWVADILSWLTLIGIVYLIAVRQKNHPRSLGRDSRFFGSTFWQAYFVEAIIFGVVVCGMLLRGLEYQLGEGTKVDFPLTWFVGGLFSGLDESGLKNTVYLIAMIKIIISMTWLITISRNITMGVAWHRFTAWFNIWFKRESDGSTALGGLQPIYVKGKPLDLENLEELEEEDFAKLGVGKVEDFTWKGILDFTTCTECGRCQSQCPAWATDKPLSPKLLVMGLRDHAYAKAPLLALSEAEQAELTDEQKAELERPLIGDESAYGVIDPDVLWSCTNCGACVQQCPVDIEHVDHIDDMRRFQVLVESNFPAELNNIFKGLERKGNPWGMDPKGRMDWAKKLDFEVKQVGVDVEDLDEVEWLFWVGCAGAFEDRAKKTTQAVAELLDIAGVSFAVLGDGETCTGDPARRAGNEIVFAQLAMQNAEVFKETKVKKVVSTCAHCFNTLKNEYAEFGVELEVVHHTQLLNRLVREGKLTPLAPGAETEKKKITYHDPCFLGRHNQVYEPPRELLSIIPGAEFTEMPRNTEKSFCCGAGGARMWMEESLGSRINVNRTEEAIATGADQIAVGCPFCRVMLSDGLTLKQSEGQAREEVEVLDVAQMLLAGVKRKAPPVEPDEAPSAAAAPPVESAAGAVTAEDRAAAAAHNIEVDDKGSRTGDTPEDVPAAKAEPVPAPEPVHTPEAEATTDPADEAEPNADDEADAESISRTEDAGPAATATVEEPAQPDEEPADDRDASDKEAAAWANVGPVNTDVATSSTTGDSTTEEMPVEPVEASRPESTPDTDAPAEKVTAVPDETEPVEEEAREEEADAADTEAKAETTPSDIPPGEIIAVEDVESTSDPVSEDAAPLSDANPSGGDLSAAATAAAADDETAPDDKA